MLYVAQEELEKRAYASTAHYLKASGWTIERLWFRGFIVAQDMDEETVFVAVNVRPDSSEGFVEEEIDRYDFESALCEWFEEHSDTPPCAVRCDAMSLVVVGNSGDKAVLRHHKNVIRLW